jgi:hypothetical protein
MKSGKMTLFAKVLLITIVPLVLLGLILQTINYRLSKNSFSALSNQFEETLNHLSSDSTGELVKMSEQSGRDLLQEIRIAVGNSLQPGEAAKFLGLAKQQAALEQVEEFSFYGPNGELELSSNEHTDRKTIAPDVQAEAHQTRQLVIRGSEGDDPTMRFYQPLFMDADMVRMNPEYKVGQFYGFLFVEFNKHRILNSIQSQKTRIAEAVEASKQTARSVIAHMVWISFTVVGIFLTVLVVITVPLVTRTVIRPMKIAIAANQKIAEYLSSVASEFNSASEVIAKGASEQAAGLEETSSSLEEITSMTRNNADNAEQANTLAAQARKAADTGVEAIRQMDTAIQGIRTSADETAKIVKVIDEIAFQTNLLALNAAVEAARAGEAGKGFAVVAEEVRNLAIRSAEAAKDTSGKIELSVKQAQNGVTLASGVSKALDEIATQIGKTAELVQKISHASKEQTQGIEQISTSIAQMDKITQQNASNAEQSASSAQELNSQANQLMDAVNSLVSQIGNISKEAEQMQTKCCA